MRDEHQVTEALEAVKSELEHPTAGELLKVLRAESHALAEPHRWSRGLRHGIGANRASRPGAESTLGRVATRWRR
jgi:hypothetical protein